jgi:hypothetical protein
MSGDKYLILVNGNVTEKQSVQVSGGSSDDGKLPALNSDGLLDPSFLSSPPSHKTANYTMTINDYCLTFTCTSGNLTYQLLAATTSGLASKEIEIKNLAESTFNLLITPAGSDKLDNINDSYVLTPGAGFSIRTNQVDGYTLH